MIKKATHNAQKVNDPNPDPRPAAVRGVDMGGYNSTGHGADGAGQCATGLGM
jgi:hypothetical protein